MKTIQWGPLASKVLDTRNRRRQKHSLCPWGLIITGKDKGTANDHWNSVLTYKCSPKEQSLITGICPEPWLFGIWHPHPISGHSLPPQAPNATRWPSPPMPRSAWLVSKDSLRLGVWRTKSWPGSLKFLKKGPDVWVSWAIHLAPEVKTPACIPETWRATRSCIQHSQHHEILNITHDPSEEWMLVGLRTSDIISLYMHRKEKFKAIIHRYIPPPPQVCLLWELFCDHTGRVNPLLSCTFATKIVSGREVYKNGCVLR